MPDREQLNLRAAGRGPPSSSHRGADVGLVGRNVIAAGDDGPHTIGIERGGADAKPAIPDGERNLRRRDRECAGQQRRLDDLLQPGIVLRLPAVAGADRHLEGAQIEAGESLPAPASRVPLPDSAPASADALRPWLASVICIEARPAGIARLR